MNKSLRIELRLLLLLSDYLIISILFFYYLFYRYDYLYKEKTFETLKRMFEDQFKAYFLFLISWYLISEFTNFYKSSRFLKYTDVVRRTFYQLLLFSFILYTVSGIKVEYLFSNEQSIYYLIIIGAYLMLSRTLIFFFNKYYFEKGYNSKNLVIIGQNDNSVNLIDILKTNKQYGLSLKYWFKNNNFNREIISKYLSQNKVDFAYICLSDSLNESETRELTDLLEDNFISIGLIPSVALETQQSLEVNYLDSLPILTYKKYPLEYPVNQILKRSFDLVFTLIVLALVLWWLLPIIAIAVYLSQGSPILFAQKRNGFVGKEFNCLKFRTMRPDNDNNKKPTERDDPRVTKLGKILRKSSLDELPQFFNVFMGDMSVVGPRPHMVSQDKFYAEIIKKYRLRHNVKPGITGLAQIRGYRGEINTKHDMELRIRADIFYVKNWSFWLDVMIIVKTIFKTIKGDKNAI